MTWGDLSGLSADQVAARIEQWFARDRGENIP